ncbi:MAG: NIPSNAP family protein [Bacteroidales bacterium]|nr:NIPSNAP family protein [Bacteroidales bacterium]
MKRSLAILAAVCSLLVASCDVESERDVLQLKIYRYQSADQEARLDQYLGSAYIPALHRANINQVGVFKPVEEKSGEQQYIMVLIPFRSLQEFDELPGILEKDIEYQDKGEDYIQSAHNDPPYDRIESIVLRAFSATPHLTVPDLDSPRSGRIYELRSYHAATEQLYQRKVEMFNEGESALFQKLGFNPVFFGEVLSSSQMPHLMYLTTHADTASQKENWDAFRNHPDWLGMKELERYQHTVSHIDKFLLYPTEYSDY